MEARVDALGEGGRRGLSVWAHWGRALFERAVDVILVSHEGLVG